MTLVHAHKLHVLSNLSFTEESEGLKCDVIKIKFVKLWDLSGYSERTNLKGLLAKN